jgi:hypothetical protein
MVILLEVTRYQGDLSAAIVTGALMKGKDGVDGQ